MQRLKEFALVFFAIMREWSACAKLCADSHSALRLGVDFVLSRFLLYRLKAGSAGFGRFDFGGECSSAIG